MLLFIVIFINYLVIGALTLLYREWIFYEAMEDELGHKLLNPVEDRLHNYNLKWLSEDVRLIIRWPLAVIKFHRTMNRSRNK